MRYLYKTTAVIAAISVIELLKKILEATSIYKSFHTFFISLQFILLLWLAVSLLLDFTLFRNLPLKQGLRITTLLVAGIAAIFELFAIFLLHHPQYVPRRMLGMFRDYYDIFERNIIQFNPKCARYDSSLFYTLIPDKKFSFNNLEFTTDYSTNSKGLRDDESSLQKPDVIVLGDSYAMGWGVQQNETFAGQLEDMTGKKVLNAGMSSYGTARELKSLYRLDTSNLQYLIIQYGRNDSEENKQFLTENQLPASPRSRYDTAVQSQCWSKQYFPGKHFTTIVKWYLQNQLNPVAKKVMSKPVESTISIPQVMLEEAVQNFLDILYNSPLNFDNLNVLVVDINNPDLMDDRFIAKAQLLKHQFKYKKRFKTGLEFIPLSKIFTNGDYYILDPHLRPSGHKKVAELLKRYLQ